VIPVGDQDIQSLHLVTKEKGEIRVDQLASVRFVELIGEHGWGR